MSKPTRSGWVPQPNRKNMDTARQAAWTEASKRSDRMPGQLSPTVPCTSKMTKVGQNRVPEGGRKRNQPADRQRYTPAASPDRRYRRGKRVLPAVWHHDDKGHQTKWKKYKARGSNDDPMIRESTTTKRLHPRRSMGNDHDATRIGSYTRLANNSN